MRNSNEPINREPSSDELQGFLNDQIKEAIACRPLLVEQSLSIAAVTGMVSKKYHAQIAKRVAKFVGAIS